MKKIFLLPTVVIFISCTSRTTTSAPVWSESNARQHDRNRENPETWDMDLFALDVKAAPEMYDPELPMFEGVFPEPRYEIQMQGTCTGNGNRFGERGLDGRKIAFESFFTTKNTTNAPVIGEAQDEIYFLVLMLTDVEENVAEENLTSSVSSRNNPDFIGQGSLKNRNSRVDFIAFLTADRGNYAIVNTRLFDLRLGRTVLIAPQKDGTFRSMQVASPLLESSRVDGYVDSLLEKGDVRRFFLAPGNIE